MQQVFSITANRDLDPTEEIVERPMILTFDAVFISDLQTDLHQQFQWRNESLESIDSYLSHYRHQPESIQDFMAQLNDISLIDHPASKSGGNTVPALGKVLILQSADIRLGKAGVLF
jgi:hypothetical protein